MTMLCLGDLERLAGVLDELEDLLAVLRHGHQAHAHSLLVLLVKILHGHGLGSFWALIFVRDYIHELGAHVVNGFLHSVPHAGHVIALFHVERMNGWMSAAAVKRLPACGKDNDVAGGCRQATACLLSCVAEG